MSVPQAPTKSDPLTNWFFTYTKLRFFTRMRRFLRKKHPVTVKLQEEMVPEEPADTNVGICENQNLDDQGVKFVEVNSLGNGNGENWEVGLRKSVKRLHFGRWEEKEDAAEEIRKLAVQDLKTRRSMAELGVIPPLVAMVGSEVAVRRRLAVRALIELANGSFTNKALMVEAGLLTKLPENNDVLDETTEQEFAQLLLSVSSLSNSQFSLTPARMIPLTVSILESTSEMETKDLCLTTLLNLSSVLDNAVTLISTGVIDVLIKLSLVKETSEKSLATLGNLVVTSAGRKSLEGNPTVPKGLIEIMTWDDNLKCQESSAYILMNLAHHSLLQRQKMAKAGIVQVLLGVALLGSPLAQKRALKILQWFKDERQVRMGPHSGPQVGRVLSGSPVSRRDVNEGRKLMKQIVKQSLYKNMETITLRANNGGEESKLKALVISTSSKSLPY